MKLIFLISALCLSTFTSVSHASDYDWDQEQTKLPCGLKGSIEKRILNCSKQPSSRKGDFVLVARTKDLKEVYKDTVTGLLWGDRLSSTMNHYEAKKACKSDLTEVAKISEVNWRLPTKKEYEEADKNGISEALPNIFYSFWSSSTHPSDPYVAWVFYVYRNYSDLGYREDNESVRCVAR